ncbi:MAG: ExeM/NucH family extracellular endonuclease [Limimaricola soesokkakensis]|uniref:ExeM/NucH family extracellular endonuclease n=1 Tax=Limimaricola soesokkakensis TaxID=1343159 RepID=UPI004058CAF7
MSSSTESPTPSATEEDDAARIGLGQRLGSAQLVTAPYPPLVINEVDADTAGTDTQEFVEIFDGGAGNTPLDGHVLVFFNGGNADNASYETIDLTGYSTNAEGYFVIGNAGVPNVGRVFASNGLQNGAAAVALYRAGAADFGNGTAPTTQGLVDAVVYDTNDGDDADLLAALGQSVQWNEDQNGDKDGHSNARDPGGSGEFLAQAPTPGAPNDAPPPAPATPRQVYISEIQGTPKTQTTASFGDAGTSPLLGQNVTIQGVVTATFPDLKGFFVQEEASDSDGDDQSSEGIFVYAPGGFTPREGYRVSVTGTVDENFGMTQIDDDNGLFSIEVIDDGDNLDLIDVPVIDRSDYGGNEEITALEQFEGMKIAFAQEMVVSEYFELARYGQVTLYESERPYQYTQLNEPDVAGYEAHLDALASKRIILDDGNNFQNAATPDGAIFHPQPDGFGTGTQGVNFFRGGDVIEDLTGVLHWSWAGSRGTDAWRLRPTEADPVEFTPSNLRSDAPEDVGGSLKVGSFNVLNYFTTLDDGTGQTTTGQNPRGAHSAAELQRQTDKIVEALVTMDAQVVGLLEIENDEGAATAALVEALNARLGTDSYAYVDTGIIGTDAIKVALIYDQAQVRPVGDFAILDGSVDPRFLDGANRPALAQTFEEIGTTGTFTAAVNHLKSKGSVANGDVAAGDGAGNNDQIRTDAAEALVDWLATDPTGSGDADYMILGDLNAYAKEDPIDAIIEGADDSIGTEDDYVDLLAAHQGEAAYSYLFDGQLGTLDYALANKSLASQVTGATAWHINADEVPLVDYNDDILDAEERSFEEEPSGNDLYEANAFRASDHDPLVVGLDLAPSFNFVAGHDRFEFLYGTSGRDLIESKGGWLDIVIGGGDADRFVFGDETANGRREREVILGYEAGLDEIDLGGASIRKVRGFGNNLQIELDGDRDMIFLTGVGDIDDVTFLNDEGLAFV